MAGNDDPRAAEHGVDDRAKRSDRSRGENWVEPDAGTTGGRGSGGDSSTLGRRSFLSTLGALALGSAGAAAGASGSAAAAPDRVVEMVDGMSLDQLIHVVHGHYREEYTGYVPAQPSVGTPEIIMADGPVGVRHGESTAFPASIAAAASFDPTLAEEEGAAIAREIKAKDHNHLLAPALNIHRVPVGGRVFEYYSEDPHLTARMAARFTGGVQGENVVATPKHYVANNQEANRRQVSADVSERALREIYLPGFRAAVTEGGAGSVMAAYNRVNGDFCTENHHILTEILKDEWGFEGFVVSDWGAVHSTEPAATAGMDMEMNSGRNFGDPLRQAVQNGAVPRSRVEDMVERVLTAYAQTGALDGDLGPGEQRTDRHRDLSRTIAEEGSVLLKNEGDALPIDLGAIDDLALVGPYIDAAKVGGGGSSDVTPYRTTSPREGIRDAVGSALSLTTARTEDPSRGADVASGADAAVVFVQGSSSEFRDRDDMVLDGRQNDLVRAVADANDRTVVVLRTGGPVTMPWVDSVSAVLETWYPGQEDGAAVANVLFGESEPGGRLPTTFGKRFEDYPADEQSEYPGTNGVAEYSEGVFVGYRWFDREGIEPLFPFGHGLSYTTFSYDAVDAPAGIAPDSPGGAAPDASATVEVTVTNTGDRAGSEVVQVYVADDATTAVPRPPKELAGFDKVRLEPGETGTATVEIDREALRFWDPDASDWQVTEGEYEIVVATSSRDVRERLPFSVGPFAEGPPPLDGATPTDPDGDGDYEDLTGNEEIDNQDVVAYFQNMGSEGYLADNSRYFDYTNNGDIDYQDLIQLFGEI